MAKSIHAVVQPSPVSSMCSPLPRRQLIQATSPFCHSPTASIPLLAPPAGGIAQRWAFETGLLHLAWCPRSSIHAVARVRILFHLKAENMALYILLIRPSVPEQLGCLCLLAVVSDASVDIGREPPHCFPQWLLTCHSHRQGTRLPVSPPVCQRSLARRVIAGLTAVVRGYLIVV